MENQKLTQEELSRIQEIQQRKQAVLQELGQIGLTQIELHKRQKNAEEYHNATVQGETILAQELEVKYGQGTIDLEKGEFIFSV